MHNPKSQVLFLFLTVIVFSTTAQKSDSLKQVLETTNIDSTFVNTALNLAWEYMYSDSDSAEYYANLALNSAQENSYQLKVANAFNTLGVVYIVKADYYEALSYLSKALETGNELLKLDPDNYSYKRRVMAIYSNMGNIYYFKGKYDLSIDSYIMGLKLAEEIGFLNGAAICSSNLGSAYKDLYNYPKALEYIYKALSIAKSTGDRFSLSQSYNNLGSVYFSVPNYDSAHYYFLEAAKINEADNDEYELINNYVNLGDVMRDIHKYDSALYYYNKSIAFSEKLNSTDGLINCNYMIGQLYHRMKKYESSLSYYKKSLLLAEKSGTLRFVMMSNEQISQVYKEIGNFEKAYTYFIEGSKVRDSIFSAESDERIADMEAKYATEKKEEEIKLLLEKTELQQVRAITNRYIFISVIIILVLVIVVIIISYRTYKLKQLAEKQKIQQIAERKILDTIIETENKERKRFAEDLHDGLGVQLSTLRLYINELDENLEISERNGIIKQSNSLLDDAIANARNISNNIMPASLKENGLEFALKTACDKINSSGSLKVDFKSINFKKQYKNIIDITLFRVLTEMLNNTIKHAEASNVNIVLSEKNKKIIISYVDDGKGFDYKSMMFSKERGMGLDNMKSRVNSIDGVCKIVSSKGKGFSAMIEVNI